MDVVMIGAGYVGLVSGACFAEFGANVVCLDKDQSRIAALLGGEIPIFEPGLKKLVQDNVGAGRLQFSTDLAPHVSKANNKDPSIRKSWKSSKFSYFRVARRNHWDLVVHTTCSSDVTWGLVRESNLP